MAKTCRFAVCCALALAAFAARAECLGPEQIAAMVNDWMQLRPVKGLDPAMSEEDGRCAQARFVAGLARTQGRIVGYKAGLTNKAVQERFHYGQPVRGVLLEGMLLPDGAEVPVKFGARPVLEADLVAVVRDEGINGARTPREVLEHIERIHPFIELPDLVVAEGAPLSGPVLLAINAGARLGVLGPAIMPEVGLVEALEAMSVVLIDQDGKELARGAGTAILGHPLNAVIWLAQDIARSGGRLRAGDVLSLGSFTPLIPPRQGLTVTARYEGLPGSPQVSVRFK